MKTLRLLLFVLAVVFMQSCDEPGDIRIQNNISKVTLLDVKWGDFHIASELLPGETSQKISIRSQEERLPFSRKITFIMKAGNKSIYLETEDEYLLQQDEDLLIVLRDDTKVKNPNE